MIDEKKALFIEAKTIASHAINEGRGISRSQIVQALCERRDVTRAQAEAATDAYFDWFKRQELYGPSGKPPETEAEAAELSRAHKEHAEELRRYRLERKPAHLQPVKGS